MKSFICVLIMMFLSISAKVGPPERPVPPGAQGKVKVIADTEKREHVIIFFKKTEEPKSSYDLISLIKNLLEGQDEQISKISLQADHPNGNQVLLIVLKSNPELED